MSPDSPRLRLAVVGVVTFSLFAALFARLWFLQVMASPEYKLAAERNQVRLVYDAAPRGRILDRDGRVVVGNRMSAVVTVNRSILRVEDERREVLARLAEVLGEPLSVIEDRMADVRVSPFSPVPVAEDVPEPVLVYLREHQADFPGVEARFVAVRDYPHGFVAAHLLGYVGEINDEELESRRGKGYRLGDTIGKAGVERTYEGDLRGAPGIEKLEVDANGRVLRQLSARAPVPGNDVRLSLDLDIQYLAEESLRQGLESARGRSQRPGDPPFVAPAGAVVVLDVEEGSVVAMASYPTYDPAEFVNGFTRSEYAALTDPANHAPLTNRVIQGEYAPGSTFKLATAVAALRTGLIAPGTTVHDQGVFRVSGCSRNCVFRNAGSTRYGTVDVARALTVSSDVFFYTLGERFWERRGELGDAMQQAARDLGLAVETGVPLPGERRGRMADPETRRRLHEENPQAFPNGQWFTGDNVNLAIGQGEMAITPLQLATAYATFATGGVRYAWNVAADVRTPAGRPVREIQPRVAADLELPPEVRDPILRGLLGVTTQQRGTAVWAFQGFPHDAFPVAGKTGTAQVGGKQDTALFAAFAPADDPRYVVAVVMEQSGFGSSAAAPVARRILGALAGVEQPVPVEVVPGGSG